MHVTEYMLENFVTSRLAMKITNLAPHGNNPLYGTTDMYIQCMKISQQSDMKLRVSCHSVVLISQGRLDT